MDRCSECGNPGRLNGDGVCAWRSGCEHRTLQASVAEARFDADYAYHFERMECGHTPAEHVEAVAAFFADDDPEG